MKAVSYRRYNGAEVLEYGELPEPRVGPGSVLVAVRAAGVSPVDWEARYGYLDALFPAVFPEAADALRLSEEGPPGERSSSPRGRTEPVARGGRPRLPPAGAGAGAVRR